MLIKLVRHGLSMQNTDEVDSRYIGDHLIPLAGKGPGQARKAGKLVGADFIREALLYGSPYLRTRQTFGNMLVGAGLLDPDNLAALGDMSAIALLANAETMPIVTAASKSLSIADATIADALSQMHGKKVKLPNLELLAKGSADIARLLRDTASGAGMRYLEDVRLREMEHGLGNVSAQEILRQIHSYFFYRLANGGESPADAFDRICTFLESMMRQQRRRKNGKVLIVSHGLTIRCFVMRFLHLTIEDFALMRNPRNCDVITIGPTSEIENPQFKNGKYAVTGLRLVGVGR